MLFGGQITLRQGVGSFKSQQIYLVGVLVVKRFRVFNRVDLRLLLIGNVVFSLLSNMNRLQNRSKLDRFSAAGENFERKYVMEIQKTGNYAA